MVARAVWLHFSGSFQRVIAIHDSMNSVVNYHEPTACGSELGYEYQQIRRTVTCLGQRKKMSFCYLSTMNAVSTDSGNLESKTPRFTGRQPTLILVNSECHYVIHCLSQQNC